MKNTWAGDRVLGGIRSEERGVIEGKACGIRSGGEKIEPGKSKGRFSCRG